MNYDKTNKKIPKYQQIENEIIEMINTGIYATDDSLPTETELSIKYQCSRVTIRQALKNLSAKEYITTIQGKGSLVNKTKCIQRTPLLKSFSEDMYDMGKIPSSKICSFSITNSGSTIANILGIEETSQIYYVERTRSADGIPVLFEKTFMSVELHPNLSINVLQGSKYQYGSDHNLFIDYAYQNISPMFPPPYIASELNIPENLPIIRIANTTYMDDGRVFDYTELYLHPELYQLNIMKKR